MSRLERFVFYFYNLANQTFKQPLPDPLLLINTRFLKI